MENITEINFAYFFIIIIMDCTYTWDQQPSPPKRQYKNVTYTLKFPSDSIKQTRFTTSEEISTFLLQNAVEIGLIEWQIYAKAVIDKDPLMKIMYSCKKQDCDAELVYYQKKSDFLQIKENKKKKGKEYSILCEKVKNEHRHILKLTPKLATEQAIRQYLSDLPAEEKFEHHVEIIKNKFKIVNCKAQSLKKRICWKFKDEDEMLQKLTQRKVTFRRKIENGQTVILLLLSETMRENYRLYGDMMCFDITYKLLKRKQINQKHRGVGFFVGQDENCRIVLFGACMIEHETTKNFQELFEFFFECNERRTPKVIVTDDQRTIGNALTVLKEQKKYKYVHLLDWFHQMDKVKRKMRRQDNRQILFPLFCRYLKETSRWVQIDIAKEIAFFLRNRNIMIDFLNEQERSCFSLVPQAFVGFGISSSRAQAFNNLIKRAVPFQTNIGRLVYFIFRLERRLLNRMNTLNYFHPELLKSITEPQLISLSIKLEHLAFDQIRQRYEQAMKIKKVDQGISKMHRVLYFTKYDRQYSICLVYDMKCCCWRCECRAIYKTGMPCFHIIKMVKMYGGSIEYYINKRWFHDKGKSQRREPSRPKPKHKK